MCRPHGCAAPAPLLAHCLLLSLLLLLRAHRLLPAATSVPPLAPLTCCSLVPTHLAHFKLYSACLINVCCVSLCAPAATTGLEGVTMGGEASYDTAKSAVTKVGGPRGRAGGQWACQQSCSRWAGRQRQAGGGAGRQAGSGAASVAAGGRQEGEDDQQRREEQVGSWAAGRCGSLTLPAPAPPRPCPCRSGLWAWATLPPTTRLP